MTMYQELHRWEDAIEVAAARVSRVGGKTGKFSLFLTCRESLWAGTFLLLDNSRLLLNYERFLKASRSMVHV